MVLYFKVYIEIKCIGAISQICIITLGDILLLISLKIILSYFRKYNIDKFAERTERSHIGESTLPHEVFVLISMILHIYA